MSDQRVFISAKSTDYEHARRVFHYLTAAGVRAFFSEQSLPALGSSDYRREIDRALDEADHMVVVASDTRHLLSSWVEAEWGFFINEKRSGRKRGNLVTLVVGELRPAELPPSLRYYEVLPCSDDGLARLLGYIRNESAAAQTLHQPARSPGSAGYRELATFGGPPGANLIRARAGTNIVATGGFDGAVRLYDVGARARRAVIASERYWLMGAEGLITALEFSPDGSLVASGHLDGSVHVWQVDGNGTELARQMKHELSVSGLAFSQDGALLTSASKDGALKLWDLATSATAAPPSHSETQKPAPILRLSLIEGSWRVQSLINSALRRQSVRVETGETSVTVPLPETFTVLAVPADARLLIAGGWNGAVTVYDLALALEAAERGSPVPQLQPLRTWRAHRKPIKSMEIFPDGRRLVTCAAETHTTVWDVESATSLLRLQGASNETIAGVAILRDGASLAAALGDGRVRLWEAL